MSKQVYVLTEGGKEMTVVPKPTASKRDSGDKSEKRPRKQRTDTVLVFDPTQTVPDYVLESIIDEWLVPCLVEEFLLITHAGGKDSQGQNPCAMAKKASDDSW